MGSSGAVRMRCGCGPDTVRMWSANGPDTVHLRPDAGQFGPDAVRIRSKPSASGPLMVRIRSRYGPQPGQSAGDFDESEDEIIGLKPSICFNTECIGECRDRRGGAVV